MSAWPACRAVSSATWASAQRKVRPWLLKASGSSGSAAGGDLVGHGGRLLIGPDDGGDGVAGGNEKPSPSSTRAISRPAKRRWIQ